jgi:hypothetical protein
MLRRGSDEPSIRSLAAQNVPAQFNGLSRRTLLAGSARITVGSVLSSSPAVSQIEPPADGSHVRPSAILGSRIYSANPDHPGRADISDNPANVPPPITRCGPRSAKRCGSISARAARTIRRPSMWSGESLTRLACTVRFSHLRWTSVQTIVVAPGGSGIVERKCEVPGRNVKA